MKRIQYLCYGGSGEMRLEEFRLAKSAAGRVSVRVKAAAVNKVDWAVRNGGLRLMTGRRFPGAMGTDFACVVEAAGPTVARLKFGNEVFGTTPMREAWAKARPCNSSQ